MTTSSSSPAVDLVNRPRRDRHRPRPLPDPKLVRDSWVLRDVHALLAQIRDYAVITLDPSGVVLSWNAGAEQVKQFSAAEVIGTSFARFYTDSDRSDQLPRRLLGQARKAGVAHAVGWRVRRDGSLFWANVTISSIREPNGDLAGFVKVTRDMTAQRLYELDQQQQYAAFTHDLRAPLTAALGYVDLAVEEIEAWTQWSAEEASAQEVPAGTDLAAPAPPPIGLPRDHSYLRGLLGQVNRVILRLDLMMERHLDSVRASGTADRGRTEHPEPLRLGRVIASTVRTTLDAAAVDRVHLDIVPEADTVYADSDALERCLANVIGNALKYSDGDVLIATKLLPSGDEPSSRERVRIAISDSGRGIHRDDLETIFEPGERGRLARPDGGHGIGLNSVRQLMERQHGSASIESKVGAGTTVYLDLPATAPAPETT